MKNCTLLWREAHLQVKKLKAPHIQSTFGSSDVEKVHAVVARSTFRSQNAKTTCSRHFWTLKRCFVRQAQGILHPAKSEQNGRVL